MSAAKDDGIQQQTNSQSQAGAASQVIINLIFATPDGINWTVKPVVYASDQQGGQPGGNGGIDSDVNVGVKSSRDSNAQGQGLAVSNIVNMREIIDRALGAAVGEGSAVNSEEPAGSDPGAADEENLVL